jgi:hypothetical protein
MLLERCDLWGCFVLAHPITDNLCYSISVPKSSAYFLKMQLIYQKGPLVGGIISDGLEEF